MPGAAEALNADPAAGAETPAAGAETPAGAAPAAGAETPAVGTGDPWFKDVVPADRHDYVVNKGWKSPGDMFESYTNLEKMNGVPAEARADALLIRPKPDAKPEEQTAFLDKALSSFVPEKPEGYGDLGLKLKEGEALPPEIESARGWMKEAGVPTLMAPRLVAAYQADLIKAEAAFEAQSIEDMKALATEFGGNAEDNFELGRRAFRAAKEQAGIDDSVVARMERAIGTKATMKLFVSFGKNQVELPGGGAPGNAGNAGSGFRQTPETAKAQAAAMRQDSAFLARFNSPNIATRNAAIAEIEAFDKIAAGTSA